MSSTAPDSNYRAPTEEVPVEPAPPPPLPELPRPEPKPSRATGRRKTSIARVWLAPGSGDIKINGKPSKSLFPRATLHMILTQPLTITERLGQYDISCTVQGGGPSGQAGALRHGISRALVASEPLLRPHLKRGGFLTRDSRAVERKKYGRRKARRSFQFSKR